MAATKTDFVKTPAPYGVRSSRIKAVDFSSKESASEEFLKLLLFGNWGTGKTYAIVGLLKLGYKVFVANTDVGGFGLSAVTLALRQQKLDHLAANLAGVDFPSYKAIKKLWTDGLSSIEMADGQSLVDWRPDVIVWDGYSNFQQVMVVDELADLLQSVRREGASLPEAVSEGVLVDQQGWGMIRNITIQSISHFINLHLPDKKIHKIVTCQENVKSRPGQGADGKSSLVETAMPMLQGAGGVLMGAAFDLIIHTDFEWVLPGNDLAGKKYWYESASKDNKMTKNRGFQIDPKEPGDMEKFWAKLIHQLGQQTPLEKEKQNV